MRDWKEYRFGTIVGVVDSHGAVHSVFSKFGEERPYHDEQFGYHKCRWVWTFSNCIDAMLENRPDSEQYDAIMRHITRKYGIPFWENGHHDIDFLLEKMGKNCLTISRNPL